MKKRFLAIILAMALCLALIPMSAFAADAHVSLSAIKYEVTKENTVTITDCAEGARGTLEIPATIDNLPVTKIGKNAFWDCSQITSVTFPTSITEIGDCAFWECTSLTGVVIPDTVTKMGYMTFIGCTSLLSASIGKGLKAVPNQAFDSCESLQTVILPDGLESIGTGSFQNCKSLTSIVLPSSLKSIHNLAFARTGLTSVIIPNRVEELQYQAFYGCSDLDSASLGSGLKGMGGDVFSHCTALENIVIPDSVTKLTGSNFASCTSLKTATIGGGVENLDDASFIGCTALETVIVREGVKVIGNNTFWDCKNIKTLYLPSSLYDIQKTAFRDATTLTDIYFAGTAYAWGGMSIGEDNDPVLNATMHYLPFGDVAGSDYFYIPMTWAIDEGITNGTSETTFSPGQNCSQAQILTFLYRAAGSPPVSGGSDYTNSKVEPSKYYYNAMLWADRQGVVTDIALDPDADCTRGDVVTYLWRLADKPAASTSVFTDVPASAPYAQAVAWAVEKGITNGTSATTFSPDQVCTRGQIVTFLYRAYQ